VSDFACFPVFVDGDVLPSRAAVVGPDHDADTVASRGLAARAAGRAGVVGSGLEQSRIGVGFNVEAAMALRFPAVPAGAATARSVVRVWRQGERVARGPYFRDAVGVGLSDLFGVGVWRRWMLRG
jgi:hypothetical protein